MLNYEFEVKVKILKLHFHNFYFFNNQKFHNTAVRENLQKYQKAYFGYETASDGYKLYLEESKNLDIFDEEKLKGQGKSVANLKYKVLFNSGIKLMDYITEKRTVLLYENFKLSEPRNADSSEFYPKLFKPDESFTEAWLVPFMFPFVRFSYPVESSFWDFFSSEVKAKTGDLDFLLLENNSGANKIDIVKKEINNEEESKDI